MLRSVSPSPTTSFREGMLTKAKYRCIPSASSRWTVAYISMKPATLCAETS
jgi:hypothetical protein